MGKHGKAWTWVGTICFARAVFVALVVVSPYYFPMVVRIAPPSIVAEAMRTAPVKDNNHHYRAVNGEQSGTTTTPPSVN